MSQCTVAFFEKDNCGRFVNFNEKYLIDIGISGKNSVKGKREIDTHGFTRG